MASNGEDPNESVEELRRLLIEHGLQPRDLTVPPGAEQRADVALQRILALPQEAKTRGRSAGGKAVRHRYLLSVTGAVVALALAVFFIVVNPVGGEHSATADSPPLLSFADTKLGTFPEEAGLAAPVLEKLAAMAERLPAPADQPVQRVVIDAFFGSSSPARDGGTHSEILPTHRVSFFMPDGTLRAIESHGSPLAQDGKISTQKPGPTEFDDTFQNDEPGPDWASNLPTDPVALAQTLRVDLVGPACEAYPSGCLLSVITDMSITYVMPPNLVAAIWRMLAAESAVTYVGKTRDRLGRPALAFTTTEPAGTSQLMILADPDTGEILGSETVLMKPIPGYSLTPPAVISFVAIVSSARVSASLLP